MTNKLRPLSPHNKATSFNPLCFCTQRLHSSRCSDQKSRRHPQAPFFLPMSNLCWTCPIGHVITIYSPTQAPRPPRPRPSWSKPPSSPDSIFTAPCKSALAPRATVYHGTEKIMLFLCLKAFHLTRQRAVFFVFVFLKGGLSYYYCLSIHSKMKPI